MDLCLRSEKVVADVCVMDGRGSGCVKIRVIQKFPALATERETIAAKSERETITAKSHCKQN